MARNGEIEKTNQAAAASEETLRKAVEFGRIGKRAVSKAQAENRALGIHNWYSVNGKIVSDKQIELIAEGINGQSAPSGEQAAGSAGGAHRETIGMWRGREITRAEYKQLDHNERIDFDLACAYADNHKADR